ncbi:MAG TPA: DUF819 family protein [Longimicrobiales bacterium]
MRTDPLYILAVLSLFIAIADLLVRRTWLRHLGTALLVILVTALAANLGVLPAGSSETAPVPIYDGIFTYIAPLAIFWLLLLVNLRDVMRAGLPIVGLFLLGALGVVLGAFAAAALFRFDSPMFPPVAGMFVGTYIGGSINFNAIALSYDVVRDGVLYAGAVAVDNVVTTTWMIATLAAPRLLAPLWGEHVRAAAPVDTSDIAGIGEDTERMHPLDLALLGALGLAALLVSNLLAARTGVPSIIFVTTLALLLAQLPLVSRLRGARVLGMFAVYLFLAVIGAFCDVRQLAALGRLGFVLLGFAGTIVLVHGAVTFLAARVLRIDIHVAAVASQANVGGGTSALAVARSIGRSDLVLPAVLIGSLGNALGTYIGFWVAARLG